MKKTMLMPNVCKRIGLVVLAVSVVLYVLVLIGWISSSCDITLSLNDLRRWLGLSHLPSKGMSYMFEFTPDSNLLPTMAEILFIVGSVMTGLSRNRYEDEFSEQQRYQSLTLAIYINALILIVGEVFFWGLSFVMVLRFDIVFTLLFYIIVFHIKVARARKEARHEE